MRGSNIYDDGYKQFNPQKMSSRQQVLYLMERTKTEGYDPEKDVGLVGKSRGSANDVDYSELFEQEKRLAVKHGLNTFLERERNYSRITLIDFCCSQSHCTILLPSARTSTSTSDRARIIAVKKLLSFVSALFQPECIPSFSHFLASRVNKHKCQCTAKRSA